MYSQFHVVMDVFKEFHYGGYPIGRLYQIGRRDGKSQPSRHGAVMKRKKMVSLTGRYRNRYEVRTSLNQVEDSVAAMSIAWSAIR